MLRIVLLITGIVLLIFQQYLLPFNYEIQFNILLTGILLLGIPHGAADLMVATQNAISQKSKFSKIQFFALYLARLFIFFLLLWFLPLAGLSLFILFATYHFGETDLYQFNTNTLTGKVFVVFYGFLILSVILLQHFDEVKPLLQSYNAGRGHSILINWIDINRFKIISASGILFFTAAFIYFLQNRNTGENDKGQFLIRFSILLIILFNLPLLLGFTFYFVIWHSILSLYNITRYLKRSSYYSRNSLIREILLYSSLAIGAIALFGITGFMFNNINTIAIYLFMGLAVLTAPHM